MMRRIYLWGIICVLIISNIITIYFLMSHTHPEPDDSYDLLSPQIAWMNVDDFLEKQGTLTVSYAGLKEQLLFYIEGENIDGEYGIYFEDLTTGAWVGINERQKFYPFSLLKVPILVAVLKRAQDDNLSLERRIYIKKEYLDSKSGSLYLKGEGYSPTIKELLEYLIRESDNTAVMTLTNDALVMEDIYSANLAMGLPTNDSLSDTPLLSVKEYSNVFRSLYYSTYLRRSFSEAALVLMMNTDYKSQLPAGVPSNVKVAHKVGFYKEEGYYHDCGIVYYEPNPYLLCVMTGGLSQEEANKFISSTSRIVYNYVSS
jgi:beta-lactamase class A